MAHLLRRSGHRLLLRHHRRLFPAFSAAAAAAEPINVRKLPTDYDPSTYDPSSPSRPHPPTASGASSMTSPPSPSPRPPPSPPSSSAALTSPPSPVAILNSAPGLAGGGAAAAAAPGEKAAAAAEKTVFEVRLEAFDAASKIKVIMEIRTFTSLGLKEAKELVEKAPAVIKGGVSKEEAQAIVERMKAVGAKVAME